MVEDSARPIRVDSALCQRPETSLGPARPIRDMPESYCRTCYRPVAEGGTRCAGCRASSVSPAARLTLIAGVAGLPLLLLGIQTLNVRLCMAGAAISGCSALTHAVLMLRSG